MSRFLDDRNPTLEEQVLGRIHRIGQDKEVTTRRFFIRDSFEGVTYSFISLFFVSKIRHYPSQRTAQANGGHTPS